MTIASMDDLRPHTQFLRPYLSDVEAGISAIERHLGMTCTGPTMRAFISEAACSSDISGSSYDDGPGLCTAVRELLTGQPSMPIGQIHGYLISAGYRVRRSVLTEHVNTLRGSMLSDRHGAVASMRRLTLPELRDFESILRDNPGSAQHMVSALEYHCGVTCSLAIMSRHIAQRREHERSCSDQAHASIACHLDYLRESISRTPTISRLCLFELLRALDPDVSEDAFAVWWQRERPSILQQYGTDVSRMPVADLSRLCELREFILEQDTRSVTALIHALRHYRRLDVTRQTMRTFVNHFLMSPDSDIALTYHHIRKRPSSIMSVTDVAGLFRYAPDITGWLEQGLQDQVICNKLRHGHAVTCSVALIAAFRQRQCCLARVQESWAAEITQTFMPASYRDLPSAATSSPQSQGLLQWIHHCSWLFCPDCGRRRPNTSLDSLSSPDVCEVGIPCTHKRNYYGKCGRPSSHHVHVPPDDRVGAQLEAFTTMEAYVCPRREDPRYQL